MMGIMANEKVSASVQPSKAAYWTGWVLTVAIGLLMLSSGINLARKAAFVLPGLAHLGYAESVALWIGIAATLGSMLYLVPRTAVLGAIVLTGYLGGATASHARIGEAFFVAPVVVGIAMWGSLFLRSPRMREMMLGGLVGGRGRGR
jgi:DoxX-like protein